MRPIRDIFRSYAEFDAQGRHVNGTDKQSNHAYGDAYEQLLPDRGAIRLMMEIGVADGSSLLAWEEILPNATIVGMDIHPAAKWRGEFHLGDQRSQEDCERAAAGRQFDLIVEDATHQLGDTLVTLLYLWPSVKPGGLYVVEEFCGATSLRKNLEALFPDSDPFDGAPQLTILDTVGPFGGAEPLVVFRRPL